MAGHHSAESISHVWLIGEKPKMHSCMRWFKIFSFRNESTNQKLDIGSPQWCRVTSKL